MSDRITAAESLNNLLNIIDKECIEDYKSEAEEHDNEPFEEHYELNGAVLISKDDENWGEMHWTDKMSYGFVCGPSTGRLEPSWVSLSDAVSINSFLEKIDYPAEVEIGSSENKHDIFTEDEDIALQVIELIKIKLQEQGIIVID